MGWLPGLSDVLDEIQACDAGRLWVMIDAAGLPEGLRSIDARCFQQLECLFVGDLAIELEDVAHYLGIVNLLEDSFEDHLNYLLSVGCAVMLIDRGLVGTFTEIHRHFRKFNEVYDPAGNAMFFRYYDPRVLPGVLASLNARQLASFFGPFESFVVPEGEQPLLRLRVFEGRLEVRPFTSEA